MAAPLEGIRVLDLSWVMVGPLSARGLADLGADVIKVESSTRIDPLRTLGPFKNAQSGPERSVSYHNLNAGKRSITVDLKDPRGRDIILRLAEWADVLLESFTPRVLRTLGLTYEDVRTRNPGLVMASTSLAGMTGPYAEKTSGVGTMGAALAGATFLIGWPDRPPTGPFGPWTDGVSPRFMLAAILAALHRRSRSGDGCYIDLAQSEAGLQFLAPAALEYAANATIPARRGSISPLRVPCGSYPCTGNDRWVAIDASRHGPWEALRGIVGDALLESRFDTLVGRLRARDLVDAAIGDWTRERDAGDVERLLQAARIPAHVVSQASDIARDAQIRASGHLRIIDDPVIGEAEIEGPRFRLLRTPHVPTRRGPLIGEHSAEIARTICGLSEDQVAELVGAGVLS